MVRPLALGRDRSWPTVSWPTEIDCPRRLLPGGRGRGSHSYWRILFPRRWSDIFEHLDCGRASFIRSAKSSFLRPMSTEPRSPGTDCSVPRPGVFHGINGKKTLPRESSLWAGQHTRQMKVYVLLKPLLIVYAQKGACHLVLVEEWRISAASGCFKTLYSTKELKKKIGCSLKGFIKTATI